MPELTFATLLDAIGQTTTKALTWAGEAATVVGEQPLLLAVAIVGFVGLGIGIFNRLFRG